MAPGTSRNRKESGRESGHDGDGLAHVSKDVVSLWTIQSAWDNGFDCACNFRRIYRALKPNDLPECGLVCTDCSPGALCLLVPVFQWSTRNGCASSVRTSEGRGAAADGSGKIFAAGNCKATAFCESINKKCTVNHA